MARPCLYLARTEHSRSWLGGAPSMPADLAWPRRGQIPMSFLAQLNLAEIRQAGGPEWLPAAGSLLFFIDPEYLAACGPDTSEAISVVRLPEDAPADSAPFPPDLPTKRRYRSYAVRYEPAVSLPPIDRYLDLARSLSKPEGKAFEAELDDVGRPGPEHQIGGYADPIQDDEMEGSWEAFNDEATTSPDDWRLLFQLDSDDDMGTNWVDGGRIYFWVLPKDAAAGDFTNTWATIQYF